MQSASASLLANMSTWVSFGRLDNTSQAKKKVVQFDYEGWWIKWLRYRNLLKLIEEDPNPFLVTSDITNFFGSVDLSLLRVRTGRATALESCANDLLFFVLDALKPSAGYRPGGPLGLPVVDDDSSRILAHFYLTELDKELQQEGQEDRYTRWVDDMVVSVPTEKDGGMVVARIERALARVGLVANSSKTAVVSKQRFREYHHEYHNEFLDDIHSITDGGALLLPAALQEFEQRLSDFLLSERQGYWSRVLRRFYTESRRVGSKMLLNIWDKHLEEFPTDSRHILDYVVFFPGSIDTCERMFHFLRSHGPLFEDVQIAAYEALLNIPFPEDVTLRSYVVDQTYHHLFGNEGFVRPGGYVRGLQALTIFKFGGIQALSPLASGFPQDAVESPTYASYAYPALAANEDHRRAAMTSVRHIDDPRILRLRALIYRLDAGDKPATEMVLGLLVPKLTKLPSRAVVNPRALPLIEVALRSRDPGRVAEVKKAVDRIVRQVRDHGDPQLTDWVTLLHLNGLEREETRRAPVGALLH